MILLGLRLQMFVWVVPNGSFLSMEISIVVMIIFAREACTSRHTFPNVYMQI